MAVMSRALMQHEKIFDYTLIWIDYVRDGQTQLVNTNKLVRMYDGILGLKTARQVRRAVAFRLRQSETVCGSLR